MLTYYFDDFTYNLLLKHCSYTFYCYNCVVVYQIIDYTKIKINNYEKQIILI